MTETQYLRATNRVKVSMALTILKDVLPGDAECGDLGITEKELSEIIKLLSSAEEKLFDSYECEEG